AVVAYTLSVSQPAVVGPHACRVGLALDEHWPTTWICGTRGSPPPSSPIWFCGCPRKRLRPETTVPATPLIVEVLLSVRSREAYTGEPTATELVKVTSVPA